MCRLEANRTHRAFLVASDDQIKMWRLRRIHAAILLCAVAIMLQFNSVSLASWSNQFHESQVQIENPWNGKGEHTSSEMNHDKILLVYSGPTHLVDQTRMPRHIDVAHEKMELYRLNFEFFLRHGIHCQSHDTLLVVTDVVKAKYQKQIDELHYQCHNEYGHYVRLIVRNSTCYDLESVRIAIEYSRTSPNSEEEEERSAVATSVKTRIDTPTNKTKAAYYDYFVYINCGMTGPSLPWSNRPWIRFFLDKIRDGVKMTGLTINCVAGHPHVQSMIYAMDREGLQIVVDGGAIDDCTKWPGVVRSDGSLDLHRLVNSYEVKMSDLLLQAGYGISSILRSTTVFAHNATQCTDNDIWFNKNLVKHFRRIPSLDDVMFFKTSRVLTKETAELINYTLPIGWNKR